MFQSSEHLIPNLIRRLSARERPFASIVNVEGRGEHQNLTFLDLDNASNRAAWFIDCNLKDEEKFLYMGPSDIRYLIWTLAAMKTRKCVSDHHLPLIPRHSLVGPLLNT